MERYQFRPNMRLASLLDDAGAAGAVIRRGCATAAGTEDGALATDAEGTEVAASRRLALLSAMAPIKSPAAAP